MALASDFEGLLAFFAGSYKAVTKFLSGFFRGFVLSVTDGGEGGIRTHDTVPRMLAFEASTFNHSVTSPRWLALLV